MRPALRGRLKIVRNPLFAAFGRAGMIAPYRSITAPRRAADQLAVFGEYPGDRALYRPDFLSRASISWSVTSRCSLRPGMSMVILSPSLTAAIGPPAYASGDT